MSGSAGAREEGLRLLQVGELNGALSLLKQAVTADPTDGKAFGLLGVCFARLGDTSNAVAALQHAATLLPNDPAMRFNLGMTLFHAQRFAESRQALQQALSLDPNHTGARDLIVRLDALGPAAYSAAPGLMSQPMGTVAPPPDVPLPTSAAPQWNPSSSSGGPVAPPMPSWSSPPGAGTPPSTPAWSTPAPSPGAFPTDPPPAPGGFAPTPFTGAPGIGVPTPTSGTPLPGNATPAPPLSGVPGTEPVLGMPPTGWPPTTGADAPVGGLQYAPSVEVVPEGTPPGIMRRMVRGVFWGMVYGHQWTLWQAISGVLFGSAFKEGFLLYILFFAVINTFFGAVTGFIIGAANAKEGNANNIAVASGMVILLLRFALGGGNPLEFINIFFYWIMGRSVGEGIAKRVHQPVGV